MPEAQKLSWGQRQGWKFGLPRKSRLGKANVSLHVSAITSPGNNLLPKFGKSRTVSVFLPAEAVFVKCL